MPDAVELPDMVELPEAVEVALPERVADREGGVEMGQKVSQ